MWSIFGKGRLKAEERVRWLDVACRASVGEFQQFLRKRYGVVLVGGERILADQVAQTEDARYTVFGDPEDLDLPVLPADRLPDGFSAEFRGKYFVASYRSPSQSLQVIFGETEGGAGRLQGWAETFRASQDLIGSAVLTAVNRFGEVDTITRQRERERATLDQLNRQLREPDGAERALRDLAQAASHDWVFVFLCHQMDWQLVPVAASDGGLLERLASVRIEDLGYADDLFRDPPGALVCTELTDQSSCNCRMMYDAGARSAVFLAFGSEAIYQGEGEDTRQRRPRGVLGFYRSDQNKPRSTTLLFIRHSAREIAGWVNENDEHMERTAIVGALAAAEEACRRAEDSEEDNLLLTRSPDLLSETVQGFRDSIEEALDISQAYDRESMGVAVLFSHPRDTVATGDLSQDLAEMVASFDGPSLLPSGSVDGPSAIVWCRPESPIRLVIQADRAHLGTLRTRVYEALYNVARLVHRFIEVERLRVHTTLVTFHEIRQPLQGMLTSAQNLERQVENVSLSRRDLKHMAQDLGRNVTRLDVLFQLVNLICGLDTTAPSLEPMLLEQDVLRPTRRLLAPLAEKSGLKIADTIAYELVPTIVSDANLLSEIFYNLYANAIKYSAKGSEIKTYCCAVDEGAERGYFVEIENQAPEIQADEVERVFALGFRGSAAERAVAGLGMGLALSARMAGKLGMVLQLKSRGEGGNPVVFRLWIPKELEK